MLRPLPNRILVKLLPRYAEEQSKLNLILVDKKKHYEALRRGEVKSVGAKVYGVNVGDIILFRGDSGESFDFDREGNVNDGTDWRRLRMSDIMVVEEPAQVAV